MLKQIMLRQKFFKPVPQNVCVCVCLNNSSKNRNFNQNLVKITLTKKMTSIPPLCFVSGGSPLNLLSLQDNTDSRVSASGGEKG